MENRSHALIAGLFTILLGLAALAAVWWFGGKHEATRSLVVVTQQNVTGLNPQAQVRYRGIPVGKLQSIGIDPQDPRNILITMNVNDKLPLTRGTRAKLGYQGVTGIAHILLEDDGSDPRPLEGSAESPPRIAMQSSLLEELSTLGGDTMRQARDLLLAVNQLLGPENRERVARTLANMESGSNDASRTAAQLRALLSPENVTALSSTLARLDAAAGEAAPTLAEARGLLVSLRATSERVEEALAGPENGVVALAPRVNELVGEMAATSQQLNRVLQVLERAPQSVVFGAPGPLPGPGETGFVAPSAVQPDGGPALRGSPGEAGRRP